MALRNYKPYTKSMRGTILVDRSNLWKGKPEKTLTKKSIDLLEEIIKVELHQDTEVLVIKKNIELLILLETNSVQLLKLKDLSTIHLEVQILCW